MARSRKSNGSGEKQVTRYTYDDVREPQVPETGHTALLPADELVVTLPMDNGWSKAIEVGKLPDGDDRPVMVDMDPAADPVLFWGGKRNKREVPVLPLQRNEIISESRIAQIIERAYKAAAEKEPKVRQGHLFADLEKTLRETDRSRRVEFYTHEEGWKNKLICGDSLHVTESLLHYEGMRGKVQMIYIDPPYGIKYDSNFQQRVDSTKNEEKDKVDDVLTIKAFRDTWSLGLHSYLSYLTERMYLCRELLSDSGSIFVQMNDANIHLVRILMDEVFGAESFLSMISFQKTGGSSGTVLETINDYILWYARDKRAATERFRQLYLPKVLGDLSGEITPWFKEAPDGSYSKLTAEEKRNPSIVPPDHRIFRPGPLTSPGGTGELFEFQGEKYAPKQNNHWKVKILGLSRVAEKNRLFKIGNMIHWKLYTDDFPVVSLKNIWSDTQRGGFSGTPLYAVQTSAKVLERCILMTTLPGDLVVDITCGSGTSAISREKLGRRWVTCDTSRVAINVTRQRLLGATFEHYKIRNGKVSGDFEYKTVNRVTLKSLAYDLEPEKVELVDQPEVDKDALRVCGPFEVMSLGRYSVEDWKGYVVRDAAIGTHEPLKLENYIEVICRLYRKDAAIQGANGLVHAVAETEDVKIAISVGPLSGRVTAKQINDAVQDALASGILEVHVLGWAFEANVGEVKSQLESRGKVKVELIMIRPDTLAEGLKATQPEMLFSPLAVPDIEVKMEKSGKGAGQVIVALNGVALFDRNTGARSTSTQTRAISPRGISMRTTTAIAS
jgi:adenine-specific DNA-methyltransferase